MYNREYEYIKAILLYGSFTNASKKLYLSQSALSQYINRVESRLGIEIFDRDFSPLKLTEAGEIFLASLEDIISIEKDVVRQIEDLNNLKRGEITIGSTDYLSYYLLSKVLTKFNKKYPGISIRLLEDVTHQLNESTAKGRCDLSITYSLPNADNLSSIKLYQEEVFVALPPQCDLVKSFDLSSHQNHDFPVIDVTQLKGMNIICSKKGQNLELLFSQLDSLTDYSLNKVLETESMYLASKFVSEGLGITLIPKFMAETQSINCTYVRTNPPLNKRTVMIHYHKSRKLKKPAKILIEMLKEYVKDNFFEKERR